MYSYMFTRGYLNMIPVPRAQYLPGHKFDRQNALRIYISIASGLKEAFH